MDIEVWIVIRLLWLIGYHNPGVLLELEVAYGHGVAILRTVERWIRQIM
jgi:hypothetical protein